MTRNFFYQKMEYLRNLNVENIVFHREMTLMSHEKEKSILQSWVQIHNH